MDESFCTCGCVHIFVQSNVLYENAPPTNTTCLNNKSMQQNTIHFWPQLPVLKESQSMQDKQLLLSAGL